MYVTEVGQILGPGGGTVDIRDGVIASASVPLFFPPRKLANHNCVDGGVRELLPLRIVIETGASEVYAIMASAPTPPSDSFDQKKLFDIGMRAIGDLMTEEMALNDSRPFGGWPTNVKVIPFAT